MLEALLAGVTDPDQLAELAKARMRAKIPQLREALASRFQVEHHGVMVAQLLAHIDTLDAAIENLHERIKLVLAPHAEIVELLCTIPCVQIHAAHVLIAECGLDMARFPTVAHFVSWAGASPGHHQSAGRRRSGQTRPGPRWLTDALTECAKAAVRTKDTYLAAHFAQLRGRRGEPIAIGAIRHDILVAYYHIVRDQVPFANSDPTGSASATRSSTTPGDCNASSRRSATASASNPAKTPNKPPEARYNPNRTRIDAASPRTAAAQTRSPTPGIHRTASTR
jgi:hypothetical protein